MSDGVPGLFLMHEAVGMPHVLLVDDEKNVLATLGIGLKRHGFEVEGVQSGPEALERIDRQAYDFVVCDIRMSPMDGYTLAEEIHRRRPELGIVLMSAYGFPSHRHRHGFLQIAKPFEIEELVSLLNQEEKRRRAWAPLRILVAETDTEHAFVLNRLRDLGFDGTAVDPTSEFVPQIRGLRPDLCVIEGDFLSGEGWRILNAIEQAMPDTAVYLLVDRSRPVECHIPEAGEGNMVYLDRDRFFREDAWVREVLLKGAP